MELQRSLNGALAGAAAAGAWAAQQPLDKRLFGCDYDDLELLGKAVTRRPAWPLAGAALHLANGALFGAIYAQGRAFLPGPPAARGALAGLAEHAATWPLMRVVESRHPARDELPSVWGSRSAFAQSAWRHVLFGLVLGELERRLNRDDEFEPPEVPVSSNGHGNLERAAVGAA